MERELHEWLDGAELEVVELPRDGRIVRIVQRKKRSLNQVTDQEL